MTNTQADQAGTCEGGTCSRLTSIAPYELADNGMVFVPQTDLAILNYIANHIIQTGAR